MSDYYNEVSTETRIVILEKQKKQMENKYGSKIHDGRTSEGKFYKCTLELLDLKIKRLEHEKSSGRELISVDEAIELQNNFKELVRK